MPTVLRWGQSAYETDEDMERERQFALNLGLDWMLHATVTDPPTHRADVLVVTSKVHVTAEVMDSVRPSLISTTTSGYEHIDLAAADARGIAVTRCPLARRDAVVEYTISNIIRLLRRFSSQEAPANDGVWARKELPAWAPVGLVGTRVAVVGVGVIGERVATILTALGAEVIGVDPRGVPPTVTRGSLQDALRRAQVVTLHAGAQPTAVDLLDANTLSGLPAGCVVVNSARGSLMDPQAAAQLVIDGHLGGLACDVFPQEPWPHLARYARDNVLLTPHSSGYTHDLGQRVALDVNATLSAWIAGDPLPWRLN